MGGGDIIERAEAVLNLNIEGLRSYSECYQLLGEFVVALKAERAESAGLRTENRSLLNGLRAYRRGFEALAERDEV